MDNDKLKAEKLALLSKKFQEFDTINGGIVSIHGILGSWRSSIVIGVLSMVVGGIFGIVPLIFAGAIIGGGLLYASVLLLGRSYTLISELDEKLKELEALSNELKTL